MRDSANAVKTGAENSRVCRYARTQGLLKFDLIAKDHFRSATMPQPRRIGYVRVSTSEQLIDRQILSLKESCDDIRVEYISGAARERPVFDSLIRALGAGDTFVVLDVDRAFRSAVDALVTAQTLRERGIGFDIINLPVDVQTDLGEILYGCLALFSQLERKTIKRRTREGLAAARRRGVRLGRPARLSDATIREAHAWMNEVPLPCRYVAWFLGVSRLTLQRGFHRLGLEYPINHSERGPT